MKVVRLFAVYMFLALSTSYAQSTALPDEQDAGRLAQTAKKNYTDFRNNTIEPRLGYEYKNRFIIIGNREKLQKSAAKAIQNLGNVIEAQRDFLRAIEEYDGDDWEQRFGVTRLWRKLKTDLTGSQIIQQDVKYHFALTLPAKKRKTVGGKQLVVKQSENFEAGAMAAFSLNRTGDARGLEKFSKQYPQIRPFLRKLFYAYISEQVFAKKTLRDVSNFEVSAICQYQYDSDDADARKVFDYLAEDERFKGCQVWLQAAKLNEKINPERAIELYIRASEIECAVGGVSKNSATARAAELAYEVWLEDESKCELAVGAFENYGRFVKKAGVAMDEQKRYCYAAVLCKCGQGEKGKAILEKIANSRGGYSNYARYDLITAGIKADMSQKQRFVKQLKKLINDTKVSAQKTICSNSLVVLGQLVLKDGDVESAKDFLGLLTDYEVDEPSLMLLKGMAMAISGFTVEAVSCTERAIVAGQSDCAGQCWLVLTKVADELERLEASVDDFQSFIDSCIFLAEFGYAGSEGTDKSRLGILWVEIAAFSGRVSDEIVNIFERSAENFEAADVDLLRTKARLEFADGDYLSAGQCWAKICGIRRGETGQLKSQSQKWWRAKHYELLCLSKLLDSDTKLQHNLNILLNSYDEVPKFWKNRIAVIKQ